MKRNSLALSLSMASAALAAAEIARRRDGPAEVAIDLATDPDETVVVVAQNDPPRSRSWRDVQISNYRNGRPNVIAGRLERSREDSAARVDKKLAKLARRAERAKARS